jgi:hypothetical protein
MKPLSARADTLTIQSTMCFISGRCGPRKRAGHLHPSLINNWFAMQVEEALDVEKEEAKIVL